MNAAIVPTDFFTEMSSAEGAAAAASFSKDTKKMRKKPANAGPESAYQVWQRAMITSAVVGMQSLNHAPLSAKKALVKFFRLYEIFKTLESTQQQRDVWHVDSCVDAMVKNSYQIDQQLLNAENEAWRVRMAVMPLSPEKREQAFALVENIQLEQATYAPMGQVFLDANIACAVEICLQAVRMLVHLKCKGTDDFKCLRLSQAQLSLARKMLAGTDVDYPARLQQMQQLNQLHFLVTCRK